jgi:hypothetical protein
MERTVLRQRPARPVSEEFETPDPALGLLSAGATLVLAGVGDRVRRLGGRS